MALSSSGPIEPEVVFPRAHPLTSTHFWAEVFEIASGRWKGNDVSGATLPIQNLFLGKFFWNVHMSTSGQSCPDVAAMCKHSGIIFKLLLCPRNICNPASGSTGIRLCGHLSSKSMCGLVGGLLQVINRVAQNFQSSPNPHSGGAGAYLCNWKGLQLWEGMGCG